MEEAAAHFIIRLSAPSSPHSQHFMPPLPQRLLHTFPIQTCLGDLSLSLSLWEGMCSS